MGQLRNLLSLVPKRGQSVVAAWVRTIFAQPDQGAARKQLRQVAATFAKKLPRAAELLLEAAEDVLATWPSRPVTGGSHTPRTP